MTGSGPALLSQVRQGPHTEQRQGWASGRFSLPHHVTRQAVNKHSLAGGMVACKDDFLMMTSTSSKTTELRGNHV